MERGLQRTRQTRYRTSSLYIDAATGTDVSRSFFVTPPDVPATLLRLRIDPEAAYTADASNYWTVRLFTHMLDAGDQVTVPGSVVAFSALSLSVDVIYTIPHFGELGVVVPTDRAVVLGVEETGSGASELIGMFHLDWMLGV